MTLRDVITNLASYNGGQTIFLDRMSVLSADTKAVVAWMPEDDSPPEEAKGLGIFIDVWHARDVIEGKSRLAKIAQPTVDQKVALLIEFVKQGA